MKNKSFFRYLIELMIVIVGVTIAFWLNTRAEAAKEKTTLENYYRELRSDLEIDRKNLELHTAVNSLKLKQMIKAMQLYKDGTPKRDSVFKYSGLIGNYSFFDPKDITYRSMINSGDLKLINDLQLKRKLISLYDRYQTIDYLQENHLQALDENYFPKYVYMVDYVTGEVIHPIEEEILIKNYFGFTANELNTHISFYKSALKLNKELDTLLWKQLGIEYRTLKSFGIEQQITHLYYDDLNKARSFYQDILGLQLGNKENQFKISEDAIIELHSFDKDHPKGQARSTAIALLTDQLPSWYAYVQKKGVPIKYTYKPKEGGPHDGFVAIDPGGYLLEFEEFKPHTENERFTPILEEAPRVATNVEDLNFFGSITWTYHTDLGKMKRYYEDVLGYPMVADQGWTKIYQTSPTGFIGLVDEKKGMMDYADKKAVEIEWKVSDLIGAIDYFSQQPNWIDEGQSLTGPEKYTYRIR